MEACTGYQYGEDQPNVVATLEALGYHHALEAHTESVAAMIEQQAERAAITCSPGLLPIQLIEHTVHKVAKRVEKEEPIGYFDLVILELGAVVTEQDYEGQRRKDESDQGHHIWR